MTPPRKTTRKRLIKSQIATVKTIRRSVEWIHHWAVHMATRAYEKSSDESMPFSSARSLHERMQSGSSVQSKTPSARVELVRVSSHAASERVEERRGKALPFSSTTGVVVNEASRTVVS